MEPSRNSRTVIATILVVAVALAAGYFGGRFAGRRTTLSPTPKDAIDEITANKQIRVGYIIFPPSVSKDPSASQPSGHMIDTIRFIATEIGADLQFQETSWATFSAGLQARQFHLVVAPLFATPSRAAAVAFTEPLYYLGMAVIAKKGETRFATISDLNNKTVRIAVNQGGANQKFAKRNCPNATLTELSIADISQVLSEVVAGRADAAIADTWSVSKFAQQNPNPIQILFGGQPLDVTGVSWGVRPDDTRFLEFLNTSIRYLHNTGKTKEFEAKYDAHWLHIKCEWERN